MDTQQLKNFLHLSESLNFRATAAACFITQPALTKQIQLLESRVGAVLFHRTTKQVKLTPAGAYFKREVGRLLTKLEDVCRHTAQIQRGEAGTIRLAFSTSATQALMPRILRSFKARWPDLHTSIIDIPNRDMVESIQNRDIEVAFGPNILAPGEVGSKIVYVENFVLLLPKNNTLVIEKAADLKRLAKENFILPASTMSMGYVESIEGICRDYGGFRPQVAHESPYSTTVLRLVEAGLGVSIEPRSSLLGQQMDLRTVELDFIRQKVNMTMLWLKERSEEFESLFGYLEEMGLSVEDSSI